MEFITFKKDAKGRFLFSQQMVDFTVRGGFWKDGHFRSPFCSCEMRVEGCEMALMCQGVVSQLWNHLRNEGAAAKIGIFRRGGFRKHFIATKWHWCAKWVFRRGGYKAAKSFRIQWAILQWILGGYEIISQPRAIFAGALFKDFPCFWSTLDSQLPSFNFFAIPPDFDHSKRLSYI